MSIRRVATAGLGAAVLALAAALAPVASASAAPTGPAVGVGMPTELPVGDRMVPVTYSAAPVASRMAGGAVAELNCLGGWRQLRHGETNHDLVAISGAPYFLRAWGPGNGYEQFTFCKRTSTTWSFYSNASKLWVTARGPNWDVVADGGDPQGNAYWYVCALDNVWAEISFGWSAGYMGVDGSTYHWANASASKPGGGNLFYSSPFANSLPACVNNTP